MVNISIVIPVLNSHEVLRRHLTYLERTLNKTDDIEIIIVDDGSSPALNPDFGTLNGQVLYTKDTRPWTWALARNKGARIAKGKWIVMYDIDHFPAREIFDILKTYDGDKVIFHREFGILDKRGEKVQDLDVLVEYGFPIARYKSRGLSITALPNNFAMKRKVFWDIGGYREDVFMRSYPQGEDRFFKKSWLVWQRANNGICSDARPKIYMFPNGYLVNGDVDSDPKNLFHTLTRKTRRNQKYRRKIK